MGVSKYDKIMEEGKRKSMRREISTPVVNSLKAAANQIVRRITNSGGDTMASWNASSKPFS